MHRIRIDEWQSDLFASTSDNENVPYASDEILHFDKSKDVSEQSINLISYAQEINMHYSKLLQLVLNQAKQQFKEMGKEE